ncbi:unnamed protein product [Rhizoctonia solani]|uniref:Zn(2)-C6 fungal-type domain-containing protein n=1 Tax=Rhizoctonia solani TaxID=456999 RepID=A0A8H2ZZQ5_9AGAM|nr:unnamed protein product [Rhizoctonia solani]
MCDHSCVTCEARNKKCDGTRGPTGCRRCVQAGIACEWYLTAQNPRANHNIRGIESQSIRQKTRKQGHSSSDLTSKSYKSSSKSTRLSILNEITGQMTSPTEPLPLEAASRSTEICFASQQSVALPIGYNKSSDQKHDPDTLGSTNPPGINIVPGSPRQHSYIYAVHGHINTPPAEGNVETSIRSRVRVSLTPAQASLFDSLFSLGDDLPTLPLTPQSPPRNRTRTRSRPTRYTEEPSPNWPIWPDDDFNIDDIDPEDVQGSLLNALVLDREVESNTLPFIVHCFASWMSRFLFEPIRIIQVTKDHILRTYSLGHETYQTMVLIANAGLAISKSTAYELTDFLILYKKLVDNALDARQRSAEGTMLEAMQAMEHSHEFISTLCRVGSLASVLRIMEIYAPIFRRACPELDDQLVNLPRTLTKINVHLQFYVTLDVLQSIITHRPMFFRYDLTFLSPEDEELLNMADGPGLRWLYGVPDRLMVTFARMNSFLEDFGSLLEPKKAKELEEEIGAFVSTMLPRVGKHPALGLGRMVVQESWRLAAYVYLYMGLCGADSNDGRVTKVQRKFMRLLETVKQRRNPDSFLVLPMVMIGIATNSPADQSVLLARLWGVGECSIPGTMGNDLVRILNDIWSRTGNRAAVWSDLRIGCLGVTGM